MLRRNAAISARFHAPIPLFPYPFPHAYHSIRFTAMVRRTSLYGHVKRTSLNGALRLPPCNGTTLCTCATGTLNSAIAEGKGLLAKQLGRYSWLKRRANMSYEYRVSRVRTYQHRPSYTRAYANLIFRSSANKIFCNILVPTYISMARCTKLYFSLFIQTSCNKSNGNFFLSPVTSMSNSEKQIHRQGISFFFTEFSKFRSRCGCFPGKQTHFYGEKIVPRKENVYI